MSKSKSRDTKGVKAYTLTLPGELYDALAEQVGAYNAGLAPGEPVQTLHGEMVGRLYQSLDASHPPTVGGSRAWSGKERVRRKRPVVRGPQRKLPGVA